MVLKRSPELMTARLRHIITRDTIIITHIVFSIAAILDSFYIQDVGPYDRYYIVALVSIFIIVGFLRLKYFTSSDRAPIFSLIAYQLIATPTIVYLTDIRSFWPFFWLIPIFIASFYFGKRVLYSSYAWLGLALIAQLIVQQKYITTYEDYLYVVAEFLIIGALAALFRDTLEISKEDRELLLSSLEKAEFEEGRLNSLIYSITDGVIAISQDGVIVAHNPSLLNILDTHDLILGKKLSDVFHIQTMGGDPLAVESLFAVRGTHEVKINYSNNETATLSLVIQPIARTHNNNKYAGYVMLIRDITKQKDLEHERNAFISVMAHELRTPLTIAEGSASNASVILEKKADIEAAKADINDVRDSLKTLTRLINDFSLIMDSNVRKEDVAKEEVDLNAICRKLSDEFAEAARQKGILFHAAVAEGAPERLNTNPEYLEYILRSLVGNAVKYTTEGSVEFVVESKLGQMIFTVSDTGPGITRADQPGLFKPFYQAEDFETRSSGGLGVGLYISKRLSDLLGGQLTYQSTYGKGTTFTLALTP